MRLAERTLTALLAAAVRSGEVTIEGDRVIRRGQQVEPRLAFEREPAAVSSGPGIRLGAGHSKENTDVRQQNYAPLPASRLVHEDQAKAQAQERSRQAAERAAAERRQAFQRMPWPGRTASLPESRLVRRDGR